MYSPFFPPTFCLDAYYLPLSMPTPPGRPEGSRDASLIPPQLLIL